ncbi:quinone oxidoreductase [Thalassospira alkalitolerans]|uniref:quinone oxidoreductase family protein n=1 Tax=Thalassospira alkalitolerans TaxID=1293890 RepID=UPI0030EF3471|tara:strand:- start:20678 stop:21658 length:981 start_codon:yes stop_codon:yes gene_type:complete
MTRIIELSQIGGPECLQERVITLPAPAAGEVRIDQSRIGVNFVDIYHRTGLYPLPKMPGIIGVEAVGTVAETGPDVTGFAIGDKVAYAGFPAGSYVSERNISARQLIKLPDDLPPNQIAGSFLRGMTAYFLLEQIGRVTPGQTVLIHAAAGGLGQILVRWAKHLGATTIGTIGSPDKAQAARLQGLDHAILYREQDFETAVMDLTSGRGVDYAIDGIGGDNLTKSLRTTKPFGITATIGQIAGDIPPLDLRHLTNRFLARPSILAYVTDTENYHRAAHAWFNILRQYDFPAATEYPLSKATRAHADLEAGRTSGAIALLTQDSTSK